MGDDFKNIDISETFQIDSPDDETEEDLSNDPFGSIEYRDIDFGAQITPQVGGGTTYDPFQDEDFGKGTTLGSDGFLHLLGIEGGGAGPSLPVDPAWETVRDRLDNASGVLGEDHAANIESTILLSEVFGVDYEQMLDAQQVLAQNAGFEDGGGVKFLRAVRVELKNGWVDWNLSGLGTKMAMTNDPEEYDALNEQVKELESQRVDLDYGESGLFTKMFGGAAGMAAPWAMAFAESLPAALGTASLFAGTAAVVGQVGPQALIPEELVTVPGAFLAGWKVGRRIGQSVSFSKYMYGLGFIQAIEKGIDPKVARWTRLPMAAINGAIESMQFSGIAKLFSKSSGLSAKFAQRIFGNGKTMAALKRITELGPVYIKENAEEWAQYLVDAAGSDLESILDAELKDDEYEKSYQERDIGTQWMVTDSEEKGEAIRAFEAGEQRAGVPSRAERITKEELISGFVETVKQSALALAPMVGVPGAISVAGRVHSAARADAEAKQPHVLSAEEGKIVVEFPEGETVEFDEAGFEEFTATSKLEKLEKEAWLVWEDETPLSTEVEEGAVEDLQLDDVPEEEWEMRVAEAEERAGFKDETVEGLGPEAPVDEVSQAVAETPAAQDLGLGEEIDASLREEAWRSPDYADFKTMTDALYSADELPDEATLKKLWEESQKEFAEGDLADGKEVEFKPLEQSNQQFIEGVSTNKGMRTLLGDLSLFIDQEQGKLRDQGMTKKQAASTLGAIWDRNLWANALRVGKSGKSLTDVSFQILLGKMKANPIKYRTLMASLQNDTNELRLIHEQTVMSEEAEAVLEREREHRGSQAGKEKAAAVVDPVMVKQSWGKTRDFSKVAYQKARPKRIENMVTEWSALRAGLKKSQAASKLAMREGRKLGAAKELSRQRAIRARQGEMKKEHDYLKKTLDSLKSTAARTARMDPVYRDEINRLVSGIQLSWRRMDTKKRINLEKSRKFYNENRGDIADFPEDLIESFKDLDKTPFRDLTLPQIETLANGVKMAAHLNSTKQRVRVHNKLHTRDRVRKGAIAELPKSKRPTPGLRVKKEGEVKKGFRLASEFFGIKHSRYDLITETLGGPRGIQQDVLLRQVQDGSTTAKEYREGALQTFAANLEKHGLKLKGVNKWLKETRDIRGIPIARGRILSMYMHTLNADNIKHADTGGIGYREAVDRAAPRQLNDDFMRELVDSIDKDDMAFVTAAAQLFKQQGVDIQKVFLEKNGYEPEMVDNYYPIDVMNTAMGAEDIGEKSKIDEMKARASRPGVPKGFLKERVGSDKAIYWNDITYDINRSLWDASNYIGLEMPITNAMSLLDDPQYRTALNMAMDKGPTETTRNVITGALRDIVGASKVYSELGTKATRIRKRLTRHILGLNQWVSLIQPFSLFMSGAYIKPEFMAQGIWGNLTHPKKSAQTHRENSVEYRERSMHGYNRDIAEALSSGKAGLGKEITGKKSFSDYIFMPLKAGDKVAVNPTMTAAVLQVTSEMKEGKLSEEVKNALDLDDADIKKLSAEDKVKQGYKYADYVVERTQPNFAPEHTNALQRGNTLQKFATMFSHYKMQELNMLRRSLDHGQRTGDYGQLAKVISAVTANAIGYYLVHKTRDKLRGKENDETPIEIAANTVAGWFFGGRDIVREIISLKKYGFQGYSDFGLPIGQYIATALEFAYYSWQAVDGDNNPRNRKKYAEIAGQKGLDFLMMNFGIPATTARFIEGIISED